ncbi:predicted protein [Lichtheimia corymbifera JMRC:FSU:9682]|uniref:AN1-type domain-containing protein n=1 Tax=Lichtheimia corymbifera JMRC:FSU:9682 TaxID=1263082 RepID=A0A068S9I8_9FUNG|nr:predicted protein [Lichtheimia corymbifera JMRC:FSU:9682]
MELPQLGKHCSLSTCRSLDFLPVTCPFCHKTFCGEHRHAHPCNKRPDKAVAQCSKCAQMVLAAVAEGLTLEQTLERHVESNCKTYVWQIPPSETIKRICGVKGCRDLEDGNAVSTKCANCQQVFCLRHRHGPDHHCPVSSPADAKAYQRKLMAEAAVSRLKQKQQQPKSTSTTPTPTPIKKKVNPTIELMKMKSKAKGSASVPMASRIYLNIHWPGKEDPQPMFFDKTLRIGRLLDMLADQGNIKNDNNRLGVDDPQRLVVVKEDTQGQVIDNSASLESVLVNLDHVRLDRLASLV